MPTVIRRGTQTQQTNQTDTNLYDSAEMITIVTGFVMIILSFWGLIDPSFMGLELSPMHCSILGGSGVLSVWAGLTSGEKRVRAYKVSFSLGIFFLANVIAGIMLSEAVKDWSIFNEDLVRRIAPGFLELKSWDHFLHMTLAVVFFLDSFLCRRKIPKSEV